MNPQHINDIFGIWPSREAMAQALDMLPQTIYRWHKCQRIPYPHWCLVIGAAEKLGHTITSDDMLRLCRPLLKQGWPRGKPRRKVRRKQPQSAEA